MTRYRINKNMILHMIEFMKKDKVKDYGVRIYNILIDSHNHRIEQYVLDEIVKYNKLINRLDIEIEKAYALVISKILDSICEEILNYLDTGDEDFLSFLETYNEDDSYLDAFLSTCYN